MSRRRSSSARHQSIQQHIRGRSRGAASREEHGGAGVNGEWEGMKAGCSLTEAEKVAMAADLIELFQQVGIDKLCLEGCSSACSGCYYQNMKMFPGIRVKSERVISSTDRVCFPSPWTNQVDHNGDKVMEWEEFTGFVIDQVLALTREAAREDRLKQRQLGARDKVPRQFQALVCNFEYVRICARTWVYRNKLAFNLRPPCTPPPTDRLLSRAVMCHFRSLEM